LGSVSSFGGIIFCSGSVVSSGNSAPWSGSTAAFLARSAKGKEPRGLAEVRGVGFGGKRGQGERGEDDHQNGASLASALSLTLCSERRRGAALSRPRVGCGGEEWCEGESGSGWGLL
jgi:hypothetical protein